MLVPMDSDISLTDEQQAAVHLATVQDIAIVTGGPGTGKTTCMRETYAQLRLQGKRVLLLAPTGKAAARLAQQVGESASTIHRAIGWRPTGDSVYGPGNPLPFDAVIVDESSMIDSILFARLLGCIGDGTSLLLVGDDAQLPPVRAGAPFSDLLKCRVVPSIRLSAIFRQGEGSPVAEAAARIMRGEVPENAHRGDGAFYWIVVPDESRIPVIVRELAANRLPNAFGIRGDERIQVLCPGKEGPVSTESLNVVLRGVYNPSQAAKRGAIRTGDKVINTANDYDLGVFNGDVGRAVAASRSQAVVDFGPNRQVIFSGSGSVSNLLMAWALTVHRSQGSEYEGVIMALSERHPRLLTRNLLYTGATRASRVCVVVSTQRAQRMSLATIDDTRRCTSLRQRIKAGVDAAPRPTGA